MACLPHFSAGFSIIPFWKISCQCLWAVHCMSALIVGFHFHNYYEWWFSIKMRHFMHNTFFTTHLFCCIVFCCFALHLCLDLYLYVFVKWMKVSKWKQITRIDGIQMCSWCRRLHSNGFHWKSYHFTELTQESH